MMANKKLLEALEKYAQHTKFDAVFQEKTTPKPSYDSVRDQKSFYDYHDHGYGSKPKDPWSIDRWERGHSKAQPWFDLEERKQQKQQYPVGYIQPSKPVSKKQKAFNFQDQVQSPSRSHGPMTFPPISKDQIRSRRLTDDERATLDFQDYTEKQKRYDDQERGYGYYSYDRGRGYRRPNTGEKYTGPEHYMREALESEPIRNTDKLDPEDYRKLVFRLYELLRKTTAEFYEDYKRANAYAEEYEGIDYSETYLNIMKKMPQYIIDHVKGVIGGLFGNGKKTRHGSYMRAEPSTELINSLLAGINIFNLTPMNIAGKVGSMKTMIRQMNKIMTEFDKREKLLKYLPERMKSASQKFLRVPGNKDFLQWMEEQYPGEEDKEKFISNAYGAAIRGTDFSFGKLDEFKTYKSQYEKLEEMSGGRISQELSKDIQTKLHDDLVKLIRPKIQDKLNALKKELADNQEEGRSTDELIRYFQTTYKFDLKSILGFVDGVLGKWVKDKAETVPSLNLFENNNIDKAKDDVIREFMEKFWGTLKTKFNGSNLSYEAQYWSKSIASSLMTNMHQSIGFAFRSLSNFTMKEVDAEVNKKIVSDVIIASLPNFAPTQTYGGISSKFPNFAPVADLIEQTGKFSTDAFLRLFTSQFPMVPRDFALHLIRSLMKSDPNASVDDTLNAFKSLQTSTAYKSAETMNFLLDFLKKHSKLNPDTFTKVFTKYFFVIAASMHKIEQDLGSDYTFKPEVINEILFTAIRSPQTIEQDLKNLSDFISFVHNEAGDLRKDDVLNIIKSKNFQAFTKVAIVKKLIETFSEIRANGGIQGISKKYGPIIRDLMKRKYISRDFYKNIQLIANVFKSGAEVSPATDNFRELVQATNSVETDLEIVEMSESFKELLKDYKEKDKNLFKLDLGITPRLRFRVLRDKDPRILRVGVETDCCQRIGGVGSTAAKDSFVNPLASVVILEWKDDDGSWIILSQSYFHYVPADKAYILDNVEDNEKNVRKSGVDMEVCYAYLAHEMMLQHKAKYVVAGEGGSDIRASAFNAHSMPDDPRSFNPTAGYYRNNKPYSDYRHNHSIDLSKPQFDLEKGMSKLTGQEWKFPPKDKEPGEGPKKEAVMRGLRMIILGNVGNNVV